MKALNTHFELLPFDILMYYLPSFQEMIKKASIYSHPLVHRLMDLKAQKGKLFYVSLCNLANSKKTTECKCLPLQCSLMS